MDVEVNIHSFETEDEEGIDIPDFRNRLDSDSNDADSDDEFLSEVNDQNKEEDHWDYVEKNSTPPSPTH